MILIVAGVTQLAHADDAPSNPRKSDKYGHIYFVDPTADDLRSVEDPEEVTVMMIVDNPDASKFTDQSLQPIDRFENLRTLVLYGHQLTNAVIPSLVRLEQLEALVVYDAQFTNEGIQQLTALGKLQTVGFFKTQVTDGGLAALCDYLPQVHLENGKYNELGYVFDANGCLTTKFARKHLRRFK